MALYDYEAQDSDELSFKEGEYIWQTASADSNGWARGQIDNREVCFWCCVDVVSVVCSRACVVLFT